MEDPFSHGGIPLNQQGLAALAGLTARSCRPTALCVAFTAGCYCPSAFANLAPALQFCGAAVKRLKLTGRLPACGDDVLAVLATHLRALTDLDLDLSEQPNAACPSAAAVAGRVLSALGPRLQAVALRGLQGWAPHLSAVMATLEACRGLRRLEVVVWPLAEGSQPQSSWRNPVLPLTTMGEAAKLSAALLPAIGRLTALTHLSIAGTWPLLLDEENDERAAVILPDKRLEELRHLSALTKLQSLILRFDDAPALSEVSFACTDAVSRAIQGAIAPLAQLRCLDLHTLPLTYDTCRTLAVQHPGLTELAFGYLATPRANAAATFAAPFPPHMPTVPLPPSLRLLRLCAASHRLRDLAALARDNETSAPSAPSVPSAQGLAAGQGDGSAGLRLVLQPFKHRNRVDKKPVVMFTSNHDCAYERTPQGPTITHSPELDLGRVAEQVRALVPLLRGPGPGNTALAASAHSLTIGRQSGCAGRGRHTAWMRELAPLSGALRRLQLFDLKLAEGDLAALAQVAPAVEELTLSDCAFAGPRCLAELAPLYGMTDLHIAMEGMQDLLAVPGSEEALWALVRGLGPLPSRAHMRIFIFESFDEEGSGAGSGSEDDDERAVPSWRGAKEQVQAMLLRLREAAAAQGLKVLLQLRSEW
ncbi:hypothetical protein HYH03_016474 [Edaphochlamys debaryana]|uniref:Uncharacterized protein n=1 Tax=Edaphochlamys debaryana TaxID=47281 RepID=A0A835XHG8_9CHLO|nr:hypothetical protein HYH03_016474 [Edaphochlamys debaryana]|eukprot:KAG2484727.1 hypothetical protein HYH03_016474 [Edaphochlamys debaryana]